MKQTLLSAIRVKNFKAIADSKTIKLTPLTVFIGNNGSGKSSVIEAMETYSNVVFGGLDCALQQWHGFEHVWNKAAQHKNMQGSKSVRPHHSNPMSIALNGRCDSTPFSARMDVNAEPGGNRYFIQLEQATFGKKTKVSRNDRGRVTKEKISRASDALPRFLNDGSSLLLGTELADIFPWQFLTLTPQAMGEPVPQTRTRGAMLLAKDGANVAEYLLWIRDQDRNAFEGILEALQFVLPYAKDIQPQITSELERAVYLQMSEKDFKVPGWLLSSGTLRILALLALLRSPSPPPLIAIEEIENGLDPRSVHLIVEEIRNAVEAGRTQVLMTTHSPYLMDLLDLSHIVLAERVGDRVAFARPENGKTLKRWAKDFATGQLYTMGRIHAEVRR